MANRPFFGWSGSDIAQHNQNDLYIRFNLNSYLVDEPYRTSKGIEIFIHLLIQWNSLLSIKCRNIFSCVIIRYHLRLILYYVHVWWRWWWRCYCARIRITHPYKLNFYICAVCWCGSVSLFAYLRRIKYIQSIRMLLYTVADMTFNLIHVITFLTLYYV